MVLNKALLAGLIGVSLCMANISGIVTDTATTPIAGAVVKLEKGGQTAISGIDGSFAIATNAIIPITGKSLRNGLSSRILGNMLKVTIVERSAVEVTIYAITGKALSTVLQTMDAGNHSIALPQQSAGIYLYKVKVGNNEFVLKGNSVNSVSNGSAISSKGSSSNLLAKQAMSAAAINDVIVSTKNGYLNYRVVVTNSDTIGIAIKMIASAGTVTDADGNEYQTVRIGNQVWMVENLRVTKYNDNTPIPVDTSSKTWADTTPKYCFYKNTTNADSIKKYGALYNWYVVRPKNSKKIAPAGWHVPTDAEWTILEKYMILNGYNWDGTTDTTKNNKIAKSLASKTDWSQEIATYLGEIGYNLTKNNRSGFSALPGGSRDDYGDFGGRPGGGIWWSATEVDAFFAYYRALGSYSENLYRDDVVKWVGVSVRLLRD